MQLLHFVHRAEAEFFLPRAEPLEFPLPGAYTIPGGILIISGEGALPSLSYVSAMLGAYPQIDTVIHYGLAARLAPLPHGVVSVRTLYQANGSEPDFHSITTSDAQAREDLLSVARRLLDPEQSTQFSHFAGMLDREAYGAAFAAHLFRQKVFIYKIPVDSVENGKVCTDIRNLSSTYSQMYLEHYEANHQNAKKEETAEIELPEGFYFTVHQKHLYKKYLQYAEIDSADPELLDFVRQGIKHPKKRTARLLEILRKENNPIEARAEELLDELFAPYRHKGVDIKLPDAMETNSIRLSLDISRFPSMKEAAETIASFPREQAVRIMNGSFSKL